MGRPPRAVRAPGTPWASTPPAWAVWAAWEDGLEAARATALVGGAPASFGTWRSALRNYFAFADKVLGKRGLLALGWNMSQTSCSTPSTSKDG